MATNSHIEWTDATWNPVTGCAKISPGCKHCYAERMANRLQLMGQANYSNGFKLTLRGYDPEVDYDVLTRQAIGRRVSALNMFAKRSVAVP